MTIRNILDEVRDRPAARAEDAGQSLQEYMRALIIEAGDGVGNAEVLRRARSRMDGSAVTTESILAALRADRR